MEARRHAVLTQGINPDDTIPTWMEPRFDSAAPGSGIRLASSERPTLPPPREDQDQGDVMVSHIHLGPSVDEVLYRLSLGDLSGAALANEELEDCVPSRSAAPVILAALDLSYLEQFLFAAVDGRSTWGDILDTSPFTPKETLQSLCDLVDKGAIVLAR